MTSDERGNLEGDSKPDESSKVYSAWRTSSSEESRRRYEYWCRMGRIDPNENQEESKLPDEWAAARYEWGYSTDEQPRDPNALLDSWSDTEEDEEVEVEVEVEAEVSAPVVTKIPDEVGMPSTAAASD